MTDVPDAPLPTLDRLGVPVSALSNLDSHKIAHQWLTSFSKAAEESDASTIISTLLPDAFWRDMLALTWDMRTFSGHSKILTFLNDQLPLAKLHDFSMKDEYVELQQPYPDLAWISLMFDFSTGVGKATGVARLVPTANGEWKAHVVFTNLESLTGFPEKIGALRNHNSNHGKWESQRKKEIDFVDSDPVAIIIGGGQSGLQLAARLKALDIPSLILEQNPRIGDNWRNRYEALCLHDPVWYDHMPYLPFPSSWPVYSPSKKLANWLEHYAEALELNVWTSSTTTSVSQDPSTNKWHITVKRGQDGEERKFIVNHLIFATGLAGIPKIPIYPGMDNFKGQILHSSQHKKASDHQGKKVVLVGAGTSAHDIASDYYHFGVDVTMLQRGSTYVMSTKNGWKVLLEGLYSEKSIPVDIADRFTASFPHHMSIGLNQRSVAKIAELDKDILDALHKVGFRTNLGIKGTGFSLLGWSRLGGIYFDTGASTLIADGKIKLKNDSVIKNFTETSIVFENGTELAADVVIFATGLGKMRDQIWRVGGDTLVNRCKPIWGLDSEGELNGVWRDLGVPNMWYMIGSLALCRFYSTHVALQIKAIEEGVFTRRYGPST